MSDKLDTWQFEQHKRRWQLLIAYLVRKGLLEEAYDLDPDTAVLAELELQARSNCH
jgi:hypothetical protein